MKRLAILATITVAVCYWTFCVALPAPTGERLLPLPDGRAAYVPR